MGRIILIFLIFAVTASAGNIRLKEPPKELGKYYPPNSEGYPFVSLMHTLSLSLTGTVVSIKEKDWKNAEKWALKLKKNYLKIGDKVKKWDKLLKKEAVNNLVLSVKKRDVKGFKQNLQIVGKSCVQCHKNYKISARILYRFPSFHTVSIEDPVSELDIDFHDYMKKMTDDMKKLKIYILDGKKKRALKSGTRFIKRFEALKQSCSDCHSGKDSESLYFGGKVKEGLSMVKNGLRKGEKEKIFKGLKFIGVFNCTKCHNTHIIQAELQERFKKR